MCCMFILANNERNGCKAMAFLSGYTATKSGMGTGGV